MEPNSEPVNSNLPDPKPPDTNQTDIDQAKPITDPKVLYPNDVLANSGLTDKLGGVMQNPQVSRYLGKATKIVAACAISGCILLVIAILAVVNLFNQITSQIPQ
ncbi:hypothetical protein KA344_06155 [bacterium]|jgi:hypothetical protein|nr:hypothetical protein [bacterium]